MEKIYENISPFIQDKFGLCDDYTHIKDIDISLCMYDACFLMSTAATFIYGGYFFILEFQHYLNSNDGDIKQG